MNRFREEYRELLRKSVAPEPPNSLFLMFTNIFCDDEQMCLENDIFHCLTSVLSIASNFNSRRLEMAPSYQRKKSHKKKKASKVSRVQKQEPLEKKENLSNATDIDLYDVLYMY